MVALLGEGGGGVGLWVVGCGLVVGWVRICFGELVRGCWLAVKLPAGSWVGRDGVAVPQVRPDLAIYGSKVKVQIRHQVTD